MAPGQSSLANPDVTLPHSQLTRTDRLLMLRALEARPAGYGLQGNFYTCPSIFRADMEQIWEAQWIFAGHDCELASADDVITIQIAEHPVSIVRDSGGEVKAFLAGTKEADLKPILAESAAGYIFVSLAEEPPPFRPIGTMLESYLAPFDIRKTKVAHQSRIIEKGNWKMVWENNRECYHCKRNHDELVKAFPDGAWWNGLSGSEEEKAYVMKLTERCEALGLPSKFIMSWDGQYRAMRIPLTNDARSFTP